MKTEIRNNWLEKRNAIRRSVAKELSAALEGINGDMVHPSQVAISDDYTSVTVALNLYGVEDEVPYSICSY